MSFVTYTYGKPAYINRDGEQQEASLFNFLTYWMGWGEDILIQYDDSGKNCFNICWDSEDGYTYSYSTEEYKKKPTKIEIGTKAWCQIISDVQDKIEAIKTLMTKI